MTQIEEDSIVTTDGNKKKLFPVTELTVKHESSRKIFSKNKYDMLMLCLC